MIDEALLLLAEACTPHGILASAQPNADDNYARVFARDAMMAGIAGVLCQNEVITRGFHASVVNFAQHQGTAGQIASNYYVLPDGTFKVSFGGLAGRVDATTWWIVGASVYLHHTDDGQLRAELLPYVERAFAALEAWEFNGRGFVYVPLAGNWADEYVTQGYTLYDQLLRLWALRAAVNVWHDAPQSAVWKQDAERLLGLLQCNFRANGADSYNTTGERYHALAFAKAALKPYWWSSLAPNGYDTRWDMAANALAFLLDIGRADEYTATTEFVSTMAHEQGHWLLPAFAPVITPTNPDWSLLAENYAYRFKNHPHHFHNGGAWPVWLGWMGGGLAMQGYAEIAQHLCSTLANALRQEQTAYTFAEYWNPTTLIAGGTSRLCFSAVGAILLDLCTESPNKIMPLETFKRRLLL
jgi:hypothetical protein